MSKPVLIRNGNKSVRNIKDKSEKLIKFGDQYHVYFQSLDIPTFDLSSENIGGIVTHKGNPIGVIGCSSEITGDGSVRVISIHNMSRTNPESGTLELELLYCPCTYMNSSQSLFKNSYLSAQTTYNANTFPVKNYEDGWIDHKTLIELSSGKNWKTGVLSNSKNDYAVAACAAWRYNPISSVLDTQGYWYIPSIYELFCEYQNRTTIDDGFLYIKNTYDVGLGRIPYKIGNGKYQQTYWGSTYQYYQTTWGGNCCKMDVYSGYNTGTYYGTSSDPGIAQSWLKLIKSGDKWILDPTYHID